MPTRAAASETRDSCPPERLPTRTSEWSTEGDRLDDAVDLGGQARPVDADDLGEVPEVLAHGQVGVDAGVLGDVPEAPPQAGGARGLPEDLDEAARHLLHPDDGAHQGGLAAAARAEQADHLAAGDVEGQAGEHGAPATDDAQTLDTDRRGVTRRVFHHVMKIRGMG